MGNNADRRAYTAAQIREAERPLLEAGVPLMQRAAAALAEQVGQILRERSSSSDSGRVLLIVGSGNNGGDALYAGADLAGRGDDVDIVRTSERVHDAGFQAALEAGAGTVDPAAVDAERVAEYDAIVDAIIGTGTRSAALRGVARELVERILPALASEQRPRVVACDLPSGIDPDTGEVPDEAVLPADVTVTFGAAKTGLLRDPASRLVGKLVVADIGLRSELDRLDEAGQN